MWTLTRDGGRLHCPLRTHTTGWGFGVMPGTNSADLKSADTRLMCSVRLPRGKPKPNKRDAPSEVQAPV
jgi:hypothetical protein